MDDQIKKPMQSGAKARYYDPWARREEWRKHPVFSPRNMIRNGFPGLGIATVAFTVYLGLEWWNEREATHEHGHEQAQH